MPEFAPHGLLYLICGLAVLGLLSWFGLSKSKPPSYFIQKEREKRIRAEQNANVIREAKDYARNPPARPIRQNPPKTVKQLEKEQSEEDDRVVASAITNHIFERTVILTFPQAIVEYRFPGDENVMSESATMESNIIGALVGVAAHKIVEEKLRDILEANPNAPLMNYQKALGIEIISVERPSKNPAGQGGIYV